MSETFIERAERRHWARLKQLSGRRAIYRATGKKRGVSVTAIPLSPENDRLDFGGLILNPDSKLFLIGTDEIKEPQQGDVIELDGKKWEVKPFEDGLCWTSHGQYKLAYKIHARLK